MARNKLDYRKLDSSKRQLTFVNLDSDGFIGDVSIFSEAETEMEGHHLAGHRAPIREDPSKTKIR